MRDAGYSERLLEAGIKPSVGSVGNSYDNAFAETINGLFKAEVIHRRGPWRSVETVEFATLEWVDWFNNRRLLEPIGNIPPAEAGRSPKGGIAVRVTGGDVHLPRPFGRRVCGLNKMIIPPWRTFTRLRRHSAKRISRSFHCS